MIVLLNPWTDKLFYWNVWLPVPIKFKGTLFHLSNSSYNLER